ARHEGEARRAVESRRDGLHFDRGAVAHGGMRCRRRNGQRRQDHGGHEAVRRGADHAFSPSVDCGTMAAVTIPPSTFGVPALRTEDPRFLRGEARYVENIEIPGALRAVFVRSIFAHAVVSSVEGLEDARAMPGVVGVYIAGELDLPHQLAAGSVGGPGGVLDRPFQRPIVLLEGLGYVGAPYAVVWAETLAEALDAAELIHAVAEALPAVI